MAFNKAPSFEPCFFFIHMNNRFIPILFVDDTSLSFSNSNFKGFEKNINIYLKL